MATWVLNRGRIDCKAKYERILGLTLTDNVLYTTRECQNRGGKS
jgi:hypothetical protein